MSNRNRVSDLTFIVGLLIFQALAFITRAALQAELTNRGVAARLAADLTYLFAPIVVALFLLPGWRTHWGYLKRRFRIGGCNRRMIVTAIAVGVLLRLSWWGQISVVAVLRAIMGQPQSTEGPLIWLACPPASSLAAYFLAMVVLAPLYEETVNRGFILERLLARSAGAARGRVHAIVVSSVLFAVFHTPDTMPTAFICGLVLALLARSSGSLWPPVIAHATFNALIVIDWFCLRIIWVPGEASPGTVLFGAGGGIVALATLLASGLLAKHATPGPCTDPMSPSER